MNGLMCSQIIATFKSPKVFAKSLTAVKKGLVKRLFFFKLEPNSLWTLSVSTDKSLKNWHQVNLGAVRQKLFAYTHWYISCLVWGNTRLVHVVGMNPNYKRSSPTNFKWVTKNIKLISLKYSTFNCILAFIKHIESRSTKKKNWMLLL